MATIKKISTLHTCEAERLAMAALNTTNHMSWPRIARLPRYCQIPMTSLYMWAKGERPLSDEHKRTLGLPYEKLAPVCANPDCKEYGKPHTWDCRTQTVKQKPKARRRKWRDIKTSDLLRALENRHEPYWSER